MDRNRRATVVTRVYEPEGSAAAYRLAALVRALRGAGFRTTVLTTKTPGGPPSNREVRRWPVLRDRSGSVRGYIQYASFDIPLVFRLLFGPPADVVIAEPPPTTGLVTRFACALRGIPYVYFSADVTTTAARGIGASKLVVNAVRILERWALRGARLVLAISDEVKQEVIALGARPESVSVVGTGIDTDRFSLMVPPAELEHPYFVYAGTISEMQGAEVFVEAFARLSAARPDVRLKFFGDGVEAEKLRERARRLSQEGIEFHGRVTGEELAPWLRGAHAALASSRPRADYNFAYSTKALVALSCGTPVIYAGDGPISKLVVDNDFGWSTPWNPEAVAEAMDAALRSKPSAEFRVRSSRWIEKNNSLNSVGAAAVAAITGALAPKSS